MVASDSAESGPVDPRIAAILDSCDVWDMTLPWMPIYWDFDTLARYRRAGYTFVSVTLQDWPPTLEGMRQCVERFKALAQPHSTWLAFGDTLEEIDRGRRDGKLVVGLNSQETCLIGTDLSRLEALRVLGVRHMVLAYNVRNLVADGCAEVADAGLSNFGRRVVKEMNRVGMIVDCSHTGHRSSLEAIALSESPVIFSHSNAYSVYPHIRNLSDEQIRACAARNGVMGVVGVGAFLGDVSAQAESVFRHLDHMVSLVGPEHVGLGTDYVRIFPVREHRAVWECYVASHKSWPDRLDAWPSANETAIEVDDSYCFPPEQLARLIEILFSHGYPDAAVRAIVGGNFRRVYERVD